MDDITSRIKKLRQEKNLSIRAFAETIGYSKSYVSMIENDDRPVTDEITDEIMKKHDLQKEWLLYGKGDIYDKEKVALRTVYQQIWEIIKKYPRDCKCFRDFLLSNKFEQTDPNDRSMSIFELFPALSMQKFYNSDVEPKELMQAFTTLYKNFEKALNAWLKSVQILKDPELGFVEFYMENENEKALIDKIENELLACRELTLNNLRILEKNTDNNELLDICRYYKLFHKSLTYKENLEIIEVMKKKMNTP